MGELLSEKGIKPDVIISSGANRAITTARTIAAKVGYPPENIIENDDIYESGVSGLLSILKNLDAGVESVFIFGHNPEFTTLNNFLSDKFIDNIPTCGIVCLELMTGEWKDLEKGCCKQVFFEYPKLYFKNKE